MTQAKLLRMSEAPSNLKTAGPPASAKAATPDASASLSDLLVLPDGNILAHNLTPALAELLKELNPGDEQLRRRLLPPERHENHDLSD
jgi:hypothetical protein